MLHGGTPHGTASHGETSRGTTSSGAAPHGATQRSRVPHESESDSEPPGGATSPRAMYGCAVSLEDTPHGGAARNAGSHGGTPHGTASHSAAWLSVAPHGATPHSTALYPSPSSSRERASPRAARRDVPAMQARACRLLDEDPCRGTGASSSLSTADFDNSAG